MKTFGQFLQDYRRTAELTQLEFARVLGVSPQYQNDLERGRRNPPPAELLQKIATTTNTPVDLLYYYRGILPPDRPVVDEATMIAAMQAFRDVLRR